MKMLLYSFGDSTPFAIGAGDELDAFGVTFEPVSFARRWISLEITI
jgi:hypothetical protein